MSIYSNENIRKIVKLSPHKFPNLVQNRKNICSRKLWRIHVQYWQALLWLCFTGSWPGICGWHHRSTASGRGDAPPLLRRSRFRFLPLGQLPHGRNDNLLDDGKARFGGDAALCWNATLQLHDPCSGTIGRHNFPSPPTSLSTSGTVVSF